MHTLQAMYNSEINIQLSTFWDGGVEWKLGDGMNGFVAEGHADTFALAVVELAAAAVEHYPGSVFARDHGSRVRETQT